MSTTVNFEAAALLADILPDKQWHYCPWCWRPVVSFGDLEQHSYARNVLESLGCTVDEHMLKATNWPLYIESELLSYVFPYADDIVYAVVLDSPPTFGAVMASPTLAWSAVRDSIQPTQYTLVWTRKLCALAQSGNIDILSRHPNLGMTYID